MEIISSLVIEVLLAGSVASIWIILIFIGVLEPSQNAIDNLLASLSHVSSFFLLIYIGLAYVIGWGVSFLAEITLDPLFQNRYRDKYFGEQKISFFTVRSLVFQFGSNEVISDIQYDRSLLRIVRSNVFNFLILSITLITLLATKKYDARVLITTMTISLVFSVVSFFQWKFRYKATFKKFMNYYEVISKSIMSDEVGLSNDVSNNDFSAKEQDSCKE